MTVSKHFPVQIIAFRAVDHYPRCLDYIRGHRKVLEAHGFTHFLSNEESWIFNPDTIVTMVYDPNSGTALGGSRFEKRTTDNLLLFERVLQNSEPQIIREVKARVKGGTGELCGLWNAKEVAGWNTSILLARSVMIAIWEQRLNTFYTFNARYTNRIPIRLGFKRLTIIGNNGYVPYPDDRFQAAVWRFERRNGLRKADPYEREAMKKLIENPQQTIHEEDVYGKLEVQYDLKI
jgi:hypothetical protein